MSEVNKKERTNWKMGYELLVEKYRSYCEYTGARICKRCGFPHFPGHVCQECGWDGSYEPTDLEKLEFIEERAKDSKIWKYRLKNFLIENSQYTYKIDSKLLKQLKLEKSKC